ncbi:MAG: SDR family oxidoreductase [archaeon]|nr:SDR family oxidoreductase [Nanoarchaeota archaeon]
MKLKNKVVIITGASSGVGKATAIEFAKKRSKVVLVARRLEKLTELENRLSRINSNIISIKTDVTNSKEVQRLFQKVKEKFGRVNILINNAGCGMSKTLLELTEQEWDKVHNVNLKGVFLCSQEAVRLMQSNKTKGHLITISSIAGIYGAPGYSAYCSSKHAVTGFKRSLRLELWKKGIKVSMIFPARIKTEFFKDYQNKPSGRQMLSAKDIAQYLVAIASRNQFSVQYYRLRNFFKRVSNFILP